MFIFLSTWKQKGDQNNSTFIAVIKGVHRNNIAYVVRFEAR